ncbi:MAG: ATP-binding cassette domain-containing protein [Ruminococcaceae bacterium]|nr:ATP-binding cassette domain-containing protein [Oscillospiraceae bacterium]
MKLRYDLPDADRAALEAAAPPDEILMYAVPYNICEDRFVKGFLVITDKTIYKLLDGKVLLTLPIEGCDDFRVEVMYGSCGFYIRRNGTTVLVCQFISGRNLARYSVILRALEILSEQHNTTPITNDLPERFCPKCGRPYINNTTICPYCMDKLEVYRKLFAMTKGLRWMMCFPFVVAVFSVIISFVVPWIEAQAVNRYLEPLSGTPKGSIAGFILIVLAIVSIDLFQRALSALQSRITAVSGERFIMMLKNILYEKLESLSLSALQRQSTGDLMGRLNNDTTVMKSFVMEYLPVIFVQVVSFLVALIVMLVINPLMCFFIFVPVPLAVFLIVRFWRNMNLRNRRGSNLTGKVNRQLQDIFAGIRVVKAFGQEDSEIERFREKSLKSANHNEQTERFFDTFFPIVTFAIRLGSYLILLYGNVLLFRGEMALGTLHQINAYAAIVYTPLVSMTAIPRHISNFLTSASKVFEILEETPEVSDIGLPIDIRMEGEIAIKNITFGYESYNPVLTNVSAEIHPGEMIGIVGHSGSGKSTLINLIMRLYDVNAGAIEIDGVNIKDISQETLRSQMGVVLQETFLFAGSIRDNIAYACPSATDEMIIEAARTANAHDFIMDLPQGYNTIVGAGGFSLSGGERQRIAIARAIIHNPRILILDEATAALDTETEKLIQDALQKLVRGRTTLAIAHRLSTLRYADRLLVLDHGKVAEFGTHAELLENKGIYYKLVMAQQKMGAMPKIEAKTAS